MSGLFPSSTTGKDPADCNFLTSDLTPGEEKNSPATRSCNVKCCLCIFPILIALVAYPRFKMYREKSEEEET